MSIYMLHTTHTFHIIRTAVYLENTLCDICVNLEPKSHKYKCRWELCYILVLSIRIERNTMTESEKKETNVRKEEEEEEEEIFMARHFTEQKVQEQRNNSAKQQ